mmetsp:Transcript_1121/g.1945  ORF Transcript_1121/g.1945 Transcript_1121/m.1945 type:complete len:101 (-) Transcript_1121:2165-2467(-)
MSDQQEQKDRQEEYIARLDKNLAEKDNTISDLKARLEKEREEYQAQLDKEREEYIAQSKKRREKHQAELKLWREDYAEKFAALVCVVAVCGELASKDGQQ